LVAASGTKTSLAVLCDLLEERWFSMDLLADMLVDHAGATPNVVVERVRHTLPSGLARLATSTGERPLDRWSRKVGLGLGRYVSYPLGLLGCRSRFDWFHVADHSYSHLLFELPKGRSGVYCHDIDAFRPLLEVPRSPAHRALARALLAGLRRARVVFHSTLAVRDDILANALVPEERLVHAPYGVAPEFRPEPTTADARLAGESPFILHVGSLIPRKNPRFLLKLIVELCRAVPGLRVFQVGGRWTREQEDTLAREGLGDRVRQIESLGRAELAPYYRAAKVVVLPSTAEGFGLPVIEALACGTPVVASDIPVLAQVGGEGTLLCPVDDLGAWRNAVERVLAGNGPTREACLRSAASYTWHQHAATILGVYSALASGERS
jgi:glycosyltransferase involved in cell wall biosynthesis